MSKIPYRKPSLTVPEQIALLKSRGVSFADGPAATAFFAYNNYYYVSGYVYYFERHATQRTHQFPTALPFENIQNIVVFDQGLRLLFWQAIQPIEIALRCSLARQISLIHGPFCLEDPMILRKPLAHQNLLTRLHKSLEEHENEPFIAHHTATYLEPIPPVWVMTEVLTFGTISWLYGNLRTDLQKKVAADFGVDHIVLVSWLKAITELRNTCAHHMRLWNKVFVNAPAIRKADKQFPIRPEGANRLGTFIPLVRYLLSAICALPEWERKVLAQLVACQHIKPADLGLTQWWSPL